MQKGECAVALAGAEMLAENHKVSAGLDGGDAGDVRGGLAYEPEYCRYEQGDNEDGEVKAAQEKNQQES